MKPQTPVRAPFLLRLLNVPIAIIACAITIPVTLLFATVLRGRPNRKAGKRKQHGEDRRSQGRCVMRRICPRRSGLEWQESMWNHFRPGKANDKRRPSLGASRSCCQRSTAQIGRTPVLSSCSHGLRYVLKMHRFPSSSGMPRTGAFLERLEPCEGKLSRTVLRGAWAG